MTVDIFDSVLDRAFIKLNPYVKERFNGGFINKSWFGDGSSVRVISFKNRDDSDAYVVFSLSFLLNL